MSIIFRSAPVCEPFTFESMGRNWNQDRVSRPKGFPFYHYLQTESGAGSVFIGKHTYTLHTGEGLLIAPFIRHSYEKLTDQWHTRFITFTGTLEGSIPQMLRSRSIIPVSGKPALYAGALIDACIDAYCTQPADTRQVSVCCYSLLLNFSENRHSHSPEEDPLYRQYILPVLREIQSHYFLDLTVDQLSRQVYITPQYLSRLFRRFLNCSTYEYLTAYRISRAKELLISRPLMDVKDIAGNTGYSDVSHFIVVFKRLTGLTPLEYRKAN